MSKTLFQIRFFQLLDLLYEFGLSSHLTSSDGSYKIFNVTSIKSLYLIGSIEFVFKTEEFVLTLRNDINQRKDFIDAQNMAGERVDNFLAVLPYFESIVTELRKAMFEAGYIAEVA